jgi:hypothetical protein
MAKYNPRTERKKGVWKNQETGRRWGKYFFQGHFFLLFSDFLLSVITFLLFLNRSKEEESTLRRKITNKKWDSNSWTKPTKCSMIIKTWLRPFILRCWCVMLPLNRSSKGNLLIERKIYIKKSTCSGRSSRNKRCWSMTSASVKNLRRNIIKRWETLRTLLTNWKILNSIISKS